MTGWVTAEVLEAHPEWAVPELSNGFTGRAQGPGPGQAFHYRVTVARPGTYRVRIVLGGWERARVTAFLGRRRAILWDQAVEPGEEVVLERTEFVGPTVPRGRSQPAACEGVDVTVVGGPWVRSVTVEPVRAPVIHLAGDSTVTDQSADLPYDPATTYCGWGQMLPLFLTGDVGLDNQAHSGLTTESFRSEGHWALVENALNPGDVVLFQFGHNDQKLAHLAAQGGYAANLRRYVAETRAHGAQPVLVSSVSRSLWDGPGGSFNDRLAPWAQACRDVATDLVVPFIDLHRASVDAVVSWGRDGAQRYFHPGDFTHHNDFGAWEAAALVHAQLVGRTGLGAFFVGSPPPRRPMV